MVALRVVLWAACLVVRWAEQKVDLTVELLVVMLVAWLVGYSAGSLVVPLVGL